MEASLSTSITQGAVVAERLRREMESRDEKGVSFLVPEKESPSTGAATVKLSPLPETSALQKATTHCNIGTQVPSHKMSSLSSSSGGLFVVSENSQKNSDNLPSSANNSGNKLLSMAAQHTTTNSSPPPDTQEPDTGKKGTPDFSCSSAQKRVESNTGCCNSNETHDESRNDFQKIMPSPVSNVQGSVGKESTDDVSSMDKINENVNKSHDAAIRSEIKTTTSPAISHNCEVDASIILDPKRTSSPDTTEKSTNVETALKILKQGEACSSPRHELTLKAKHNPADSKSASLSIQAPNAVLTKQQTLPESSQTASLTPSFLSRRSSTMGAMPGDGSVELNPQKKAMSASKETDALVASLTSLSQSVTRNTSEGVLGGGADGRPNTAQSHNNITSNKNFFGNYPSFPLSGSHKSASTILTGLSTAYVTPGNGVDFGRMSQSAVVGASCAYASLANAMRKNEISGKNVPPAQMLSSQVPQSEEGYNNCNNTTAEYSSSFGKKAGISQERSWTAGVTEEYHRNSGEENYGNAQGIRTEDQALMLPLESIKSGGCNPANFINTADGVAGAISEHGAFQTHLGLSGATFQPGSTAAAAAAVLAQQESRPLLLTRFEMLEAYAKAAIQRAIECPVAHLASSSVLTAIDPRTDITPVDDCFRNPRFVSSLVFLFTYRGEECPLRCRFCQQLHVGISVTVCIKRFRGPLEALLGISLPLRDLQPASLLSMGTPASPLGQAAFTRPNSAFGRSVYVSNLPPNTTQETLAAAVDALLTKGRIMQVDLHEKHAFVQLSTLEAAFELVDKRRQLQIRGVTLKVQFKKTGVFNNGMPHGSATVPCALPAGTNAGTTPTISAAFSPNAAYTNGNQGGTSAVTPLSAASSPTGAFGAGASPTFSPSINSLLIFLGPPASPSVSEICAQVAAKLKEDLHMGLVTAQQQSPSASAGASRSSPPARLAQGSTSQKLPHELQQQLSGVVSLPFDVPSPQSTTMAALFSAAAAAASCQASAEGGNTSALPAAVLQRLAPSKGASYNPSSSAQNSASLVSAAAQYVANTLLGPSGDPNDMTRVGIQSGHSITTKTGGCTFGSHAPSFSPSLQDSNPEGHASLNGEKAFLLQLLQHQQETSQQRSKTDVDRSQKSLQQPALLTETLMRAAAAAAGSKPSSHLQGGAEGVDGTGTTTGGSYARRQVQLQLQQLEELQKQQVGKGNQQRQQPQVSGTLEQHLFLQRKKPEPNTRMTQGVCTEIRSGQHLANSQGEDHGQLENMTFSQDGIPYPSCGLNLAADHVYNHSATLPSRSAALKVFQSYPSTDGPGSTGTILKNGGAKNGMQVIPFSNSNAEGNVMKDICTNGRKVPSNLFSQTLNTGSATLQHPASWARIPTSVAASSGSAPGTVLSMTREEDEERFASACREESSMGRANLLFELQQQRQHKSGGGCASLLPSLLSTESTTMCSQEAAMTATKTASNRMQIQTGAFHHHSLGVQPEYPEESDTSFPYSLTAVHRNGSMVGTKERDTDALYTSQQQHDLNAFLSISSNSKGLLTGTTKAVTSLGGATTTSTTPMTTSRSAQKTPFSTGMRFSVGADVSDTTFTGVVGSQESSAAMTSSGEATQQLLDVAATLMHKAVQETTDVEEIAQQLYQATRDLPQETVHELLLTLASRGGGHSSLGTSSGSSDTPKKPEEIGSTPLNPAATPFLVH
uniref:Proteophosphoglycan 5, related n=1 Tax=Neospora caninum (strain Liverpool) TaxID=572307 RepID=A0A0F7ULZ3_NEOCL|nr:TPA: Proteophosphoglycan 5, related [Neospora caninum Liverpool]